MGRNRVSGTTILFAIVLVGALIGIGHIVNPPPPGPPEPPKVQNTGAKVTAQDAMKNEKEMMMKRMQQMKERAAEVKKANGGKTPPKPPIDPNSIDITSKYWQQNAMGEKGETEMAKKVAVAKEMLAKERAATKSVPPVPPPTPMPTPPPAATPAGTAVPTAK